MVSVSRPREKKARKPSPALLSPQISLRFLVHLAPQDVAMLRFLLEAYDNLAYFTVLDIREALLSVVCSPHQKEAVRQALEGIGECLPLRFEPWPLEHIMLEIHNVTADRARPQAPLLARAHLPQTM